MGFLDAARARLMGTGAADAWDGSTHGAAVSAAGRDGLDVGPPILDPTPQDVVDRMLDAGGPARGVVVGVRTDMADGDRPVRTQVHLRVRARLRGGVLGDEVELTAWVGWKVAALLEPGLEVPIGLDRATGRPTDIDVRQLGAELEPRSREAKRRRNGWSLETPLQGLASLPGAVRDALGPSGPTAPQEWVAPDDPARAPIDGLTWEQYVTVCAQIDGRSSNESNDLLAQQLGAPAGAWVPAATAWQGRVRATPALSLQFGQDVELAKRRLRGG